MSGRWRNAARWQWGNADIVLDYRAKHLNDRLVQLHAQGTMANVSANLRSASAN
jgi:hypothetical protein